MACEWCGGREKTLSERPCACRYLASPAPEPWIIRETWRGRWSTFSLRRKAACAAGAVLALSGLVGLGVLVTGSSLFSGSGTRHDQAADAQIQDAPRPSLILPTGASVESPSPSRSASPSRTSGKPAPPPTSHAPPPNRKPPAAAPAHPVTYTAWAGHGCDSPSGGGYSEHGRYYDGDQGWYTINSGGYDGGSCDGSFSAIPMSGSATRDNDNGAVWWWSVGSDSRTCDVGVYVPRTPDDRAVGGHPTTYEVMGGRGGSYGSYGSDGRYGSYGSGTTSATFTVDQTAHRGELVDAGTYRVQDGRIAVQLLDRGEDWNADGPTYAHHAAAQMKVVCRG